MERILTLGKTESAFTNALGFEFIQLPRFVTDEDRHDFVSNTLKKKEFDKLIILIDSSDEYDGLRLGLHVRLTLALHQKRLIPLLFVSSDSVTVILRNAGIWGRILTTKGCKIVQVNVDAVQSGLDFPALSPAEMDIFLSLIQLRPDETAGRHSLANQWGAYALDKAAGTKALLNNNALEKARKQLYFKYVEAVNYKSEKLSRPATTIIDLGKTKSECIEATGKKILLIDDEANKGWGDVLKKLFKTTNPESDFQIIDRRLSNWESLSEDETKFVLETGFDLFLIDLRLTGSEEEETVKPEHFSGTDIMRQIKEHNAGNQAIMFTASNKAWNLKALLDFGADGYYIKESPEYNFTENFSQENFKNFKKETTIALRYSFLKNIWLLHTENKNWTKSTSVRQKYNFDQTLTLDEISAQLTISYQLIATHQSQNVSYYAVTYVRILEIFLELFVVIDEEKKEISLPNGKYLDYISWNKIKNEYDLLPIDLSVTKWTSYKSIRNQATAVACQYLGVDIKTDRWLVNSIETLIQSRNDFIHEGKVVALQPSIITDWAKMINRLITSL